MVLVESLRRRKYNQVPSAKIDAVTRIVMKIGSMARCRLTFILRPLRSQNVDGTGCGTAVPGVATTNRRCPSRCWKICRRSSEARAPWARFRWEGLWEVW